MLLVHIEGTGSIALQTEFAFEAENYFFIELCYYQSFVSEMMVHSLFHKFCVPRSHAVNDSI